MSLVVIVGSNYSSAEIAGYQLYEEKFTIATHEYTVYRFPNKQSCYVIFRHGLPYQYLPHQIPFTLHAEILRHLNCKALLLTSSVGVLKANLPLFTPMLVSDLIMLDNRLPNGLTCTLHTSEKNKMHLVFQDGPFSNNMNTQIKQKFAQENFSIPEVVYAYFAGPRTKTRSENQFFAAMGADVNSMTLGPEVILANELGIPTAAIVVGHKYSLNTQQNLASMSLTESIAQSKHELEKCIVWFFENISAPKFGNLLYQIN